ncbi:MAG TPA: lysophospholipid acyltransferase family protein [Verrucomicrobiae bacterium]|jgi:KDO2-lipid IV(A) lauroyltransferase
MLDGLLYVIALSLVKLLQSLPLRWVARLGRGGGGLAYWLDARHRRVAIQNLTQCFGKEKSEAEIRELARENFRRLGENYASAIKTAAMPFEKLRPHLTPRGEDEILRMQRTNPNQNWVMAVGHFGNFELYPRFASFVPGLRVATTYRGLRQPSLNRLMQNLRNRSGCLFFERRSEGAALRAAMSESKGMMLGFLADQHAGTGGYWTNFFGRECSTTTAPAVFALRYQTPLYTGFIFRTGLASWSVELGDKIVTHENGHPRTVEAITDDINRSFERAIRRDPANWFWVHKRWKPKPERTSTPAVHAAA